MVKSIQVVRAKSTLGLACSEDEEFKVRRKQRRMTNPGLVVAVATSSTAFATTLYLNSVARGKSNSSAYKLHGRKLDDTVSMTLCRTCTHHARLLIF